MRKLICLAFGHNAPDKVVPIFSSTGKWQDALGNRIVYRAHICKRCGKRLPIDEENAVEKAKKTAEISAVMNGARARYGLSPMDWSD